MTSLYNTYIYIAFKIGLFQYLSQISSAPLNYCLPSVYPGPSLYPRKLWAFLHPQQFVSC